MNTLVGVFDTLLLTLLPGTWVTFGLPLKGLPFWVKVIMGVMLAPVVLAIEFYPIRLVGIPFDWASWILVLINLPALYLVVRQAGKFSFPNRAVILAGALILLIIVVSIAPFLLDEQKRLYTWEAWSQGDVIYSLANGGLDLQDVELAGVRLSYPWVGQVYQAIMSYTSNTPPVTNYIWQNLIWLLAIFGFSAAITSELGGNPFSQVTTAVWLSFGVNFVGITVQPLIPLAWIKSHATLGGIWGDNRYTPWLDKVVFFGQMYFGMGLFIAILYLTLIAWPEGYKRNYLLLLGVLLCGLGLVYPVLLPAACIVIGIRALLKLIQLSKGRDREAMKEVVGASAVVLIAIVLTFAYTKFLTQARTGAQLINLHNLWVIRSRILESAVVTSPLLVGLLAVFLRLRKGYLEKLIILSFGAFGSLALYTLFDIPWYRNEYKFVFTAAMCLAPFLSLALEPVFKRLGRLAIPALVAVTLVLASPFINHIYNQTYVLYTRHGPLVDTNQFSIRLADSEPLSGMIDAIRQKTPENSLLLVESASFYYPTLTQRQLYAPPDQVDPYPGILISSEEMVTLVKGYPPQLFAQRRAVLHDLFDASDPSPALRQIMQMDRPLAVVIDDQKNASLLSWLNRTKLGKSVYDGNGLSLWVIDSTGFNTGENQAARLP